MASRLFAALFVGGTVAWAAAGAETASEPVLLFAECSDSSQIKRVIRDSDAVQVRYSLTGYAATCYAVSAADADGKLVSGFLLNRAHPAVIEFERQIHSREREFQPAGAAKPADSNARRKAGAKAG